MLVGLILPFGSAGSVVLEVDVNITWFTPVDGRTEIELVDGACCHRHTTPCTEKKKNDTIAIECLKWTLRRHERSESLRVKLYQN